MGGTPQFFSCFFSSSVTISRSDRSSFYEILCTLEDFLPISTKCTPIPPAFSRINGVERHPSTPFVDPLFSSSSFT